MYSFMDWSKHSTSGTRNPAEITSHKSSCPWLTEFTENFCDMRDDRCLISIYELVVILHSPIRLVHSFFFLRWSIIYSNLKKHFCLWNREIHKILSGRVPQTFRWGCTDPFIVYKYLDCRCFQYWMQIPYQSWMNKLNFVNAQMNIFCFAASQSNKSNNQRTDFNRLATLICFFHYRYLIQVSARHVSGFFS